jgi:hypothetical protein
MLTQWNKQSGPASLPPGLPLSPQTFESQNRHVQRLTQSLQLVSLTAAIAGHLETQSRHSVGESATDASAHNEVQPSSQFAQRPLLYETQTNHQHTVIEDRLRAAQKSHLRNHVPVSNTREKSPFKDHLPFGLHSQRSDQNSAHVLEQRTLISPIQVMLDQESSDPIDV